MKKPVLLIDDDNVTNSWDNVQSAPRQYIERITGKQWISAHQAESWNVISAYGVEYTEAIRNLLHYPPPDFYYTIKPMPGAIEVIKRLLKEYVVRFVTTPIHDPLNLVPRDKAYWQMWFRILEEKSRRLHEWFGQDCPHIIGESDKTLIVGDILIDDNPKVALNKAITPVWDHILFDSNYKLNANNPHPFKADWFGMEDMCKHILECRKSKQISSYAPSH